MPPETVINILLMLNLCLPLGNNGFNLSIFTPLSCDVAEL
jgi:hypothetical protein